ncbi:MAG: DNA-directed RNA polymerase subunit omega [Pseudomonadota bacterium]
MDPSVVFDCERVLPNRFALTLTAAARSRALTRGHPPRLARPATSTVDLALHEIAANAFTEEELAPFLPSQDSASLLPPPACPSRWADAGATAAALSLEARSFTDDCHRGTACGWGMQAPAGDASNQRGGMNNGKVTVFQ